MVKINSFIGAPYNEFHCKGRASDKGFKSLGLLFQSGTIFVLLRRFFAWIAALMIYNRGMNLTAWILIGVTVFLIGFDIYEVVINKDQTISAVIQRASQKYLILAVAAGILIGHLFWPQCN